MTKLFIFDLDGTLADITHRLHFIQSEKPNWELFHQNCIYDEPKQWTIDLLNICKQHGEILILSGRSDAVKIDTVEWLIHNNIMYDYLDMRPAGNNTPDQILKKQMLEDFLRDKDFQVQFIVDDRQRVVDMWRENGYNVLQCEKWDEK